MCCEKDKPRGESTQRRTEALQPTAPVESQLGASTNSQPREGAFLGVPTQSSLRMTPAPGDTLGSRRITQWSSPSYSRKIINGACRLKPLDHYYRREIQRGLRAKWSRAALFKLSRANKSPGDLVRMRFRPSPSRWGLEILQLVLMPQVMDHTWRDRGLEGTPPGPCVSGAGFGRGLFSFQLNVFIWTSGMCYQEEVCFISTGHPPCARHYPETDLFSPTWWLSRELMA